MKKANSQEQHARRNVLSDFILGSQDGLVNVLGIILGVSAATRDIKLVFVATLAALGAESISMAAVAYTSTSARRRLYQSEVQREQQEMREVPDRETEEVREVLTKWGYIGEEREQLVQRIIANPRAWLEFMMSYELELAPVGAFEARRSFLLVGGSTVVGSLIPLLPFFFLSGDVVTGAISSVVVSGVALFFIGWYAAKTTIGSLWRSGVQMAAIGLSAGFIGFLIGHFVGATPL
ncbi:MAG TPA: VIT1/CCC1 transporter family protein [Candidatus Thermoplasmatota archaeon]|nr:VIT1/CCC1 transporter family protein [Candidatus Thermoplasmatota archaeon]